MAVTITARERVKAMAVDAGIPLAVRTQTARGPKLCQRTNDELREALYEFIAGPVVKIKATSPAALDERLSGMLDTYKGRNGTVLRDMQTAQREAAHDRAKANELLAKYPKARGLQPRAAMLAEVQQLQASASSWLRIAGVLHDMDQMEAMLRMDGADLSEVEAVTMDLPKAIAEHRYAVHVARPKQLVDMTKGRNPRATA